jgi:hypothetical protein
MITVANAIAAAAHDRAPYNTAMDAGTDAAVDGTTSMDAGAAAAMDGTAVKTAGVAAMETAGIDAMAATTATAARTGEGVSRHQGERKGGRRRKRSDPQSSSKH